MTYDLWKTTDPREYERDAEEEPTELELVYEQLHEARQEAKYIAERNAARIKELTIALEEALEYFRDHSDVNDGDYGEPSPNKEMQLASMIDEALYGIQF